MSEWTLQIVEKRREAKGKGERERYTKLNVLFWRIARKDIPFKYLKKYNQQPLLEIHLLESFNGFPKERD